MMHEEEGILEAPCGSGKSVMALRLACDWGQPTLVLAHTMQIMDQWQEYIEDLTDEKPGIIHGNRWDLRNITVASVMTLANRELTREFLDYFGVVILDEAHHTPAYSFSSLLTMFTARRRIGITATPRRADGLQRLLTAIAGPVKAKITEEELIRTGFRLRPTVYTVPTKLEVPWRPYGREQQIFGAVEEDRQRAKLVAEVAFQNRKRSVLVLSRRIAHLELIYKYLMKMDPDLQAVVLTGRVKRDLRKEIINDFKFGDLNIVLATQLADEGLDVPRLDTVLLSFPAGGTIKIEQQIGRSARSHPDKEDVRIYDFMDVGVPELMRQANRRGSFYRSHGYPIISYETIGKVA
jgi:superfamily II DNA or RNA helicase